MFSCNMESCSWIPAITRATSAITMTDFAACTSGRCKKWFTDPLPARRQEGSASANDKLQRGEKRGDKDGDEKNIAETDDRQSAQHSTMNGTRRKVRGIAGRKSRGFFGRATRGPQGGRGLGLGGFGRGCRLAGGSRACVIVRYDQCQLQKQRDCRERQDPRLPHVRRRGPPEVGEG